MHNSIAYCTHGTLKCLCRECGGRGGCPHVKRKYDCNDYGGGAWCAHGKSKRSVVSVVEADVVHTVSRSILARIVVGAGCARPHCMRHRQTGGTKDVAYVALSICSRVSPPSATTR